VCEQLTRLSLAVCASSLQFAFSGVPSYFFSFQTLHQHARLAYRQAEESNDGDALKRAKEELDIPGMAPGGVQDKNKVELAEIMAKLNQLFSGELGDHDTLAYVCSVIRGQMWESSTLRQQAAANSKEQFSNSADLNKALLDAIIGALDAHQRSKRRSSRPCMPSAACATTSPTALVNPLRLHRAIRSASNGSTPRQNHPRCGSPWLPCCNASRG